jgi:hypothetical protein
MLSAVYGPPLAEGETPSTVDDVETVYLSKFLSDPALIANGIPVPRAALINYVANKLGGTHYDERRSPVLDRQQYTPFVALDGVMKAPANMGTAHYELLAVGQTLLASGDMQTFCKQQGKLTST